MLLWGVLFPLYALTRFEQPVRHGHWGHSDPYKDAFRRHGLVRWLSIPSELQWLAGESLECYVASIVICHFQFHSFLRMFLKLKTSCPVKQHSRDPVIPLGYKAHIDFTLLSCQPPCNGIKRNNFWLFLSFGKLVTCDCNSRCCAYFRSQSEMSCQKPLSRPLNVSFCFISNLSVHV